MCQLKKMYKDQVSEEEILRVKKFDKEYKKINDYEFLMSRVLTYICLFCGTLLWLIPIQTDDAYLLFASAIMLQMVACLCYMRPYLRTTMNPQSASINEILEAMPVSSKALIEVRIEYLEHYCGKIGIVILVLQQIGAVLNGKWESTNLLYPLVSACIMYLVMTFHVKRSCAA